MKATIGIYVAVVWLCLISVYTAFNLTLIYKGDTNSMAMLALPPIWFVLGIRLLTHEIKELQVKGANK